MDHISRRASLVLLGMAPWAAAAAAQESPATRRRSGYTPSGGARPSMRETIRDRFFPNVTVDTHDGQRLKFYDDLIKDRKVLLHFFYAECEGICPTVIGNLVRVQRERGDRVGKDIFLYSLTLQPQHDTPNVLREYAEKHGIGPGWRLVTGAPADLELLRRNLGFVDPDPELDRNINSHLTNLRYGNEPLQLWGACNPFSDVENIFRAITVLDRPSE
jgi:protein SCO1/2